MTKNKFLIAEHIDANRENIISDCKEGIPVSEIAKLYNVSAPVIYLRLIKWGAKVKSYRRAKRRTIEMPKHYKRKFSPEFLAKQKKNTRINDEHISYVEFEGITEDQKLVRNIICRPIIG